MGLVQFEDGKVLYYPYTPSRSAGFAFVALFTIITVAHIGGVFYFRTRYMIPLVLGGICELFGYYGRAWGGENPNSPKPFMLQLMLILVSPVFIAATMYVTLGRLKEGILAQPRRRCSPTTLFILTDIIAFCTQIGGGLVQVTGSLKIMHIGDRVVLGGLAFQLVVMAIYLILVVRFYRQASQTAIVDAPWKRHVIALGVCVVMVWVRNLVKAIEFAQGFYGFVSQHEAMLYVFDAALMLGVMIIFLVLHPGVLLRQIDRSQASHKHYNMEPLREASVPYQ
ncbi:hypothetical protein PFICI_09898 [Pestalotiopsis fici W106-1]|uniref:Protein RTA1 n=1 Tax=Pestalotiopsis fici (strain W106-1 / CGMCC3.15140) TaxID=1229662 RepID=W3WY70_PESFW|nr:uncharacterized protein PFICI_09898 [Pestalotiopsis fici W106-1]ETS77836.1 hypothetical protein PFICI_09898 [Pestalotiopsis fici W106-1]